MGRPPVVPAENTIRIVLSIVAGEISLAEAARREKLSKQSIGQWTAEFPEGGKAALVVGKTAPLSPEEQLEADVAELTQALGEAALGMTPIFRSIRCDPGFFVPGSRMVQLGCVQCFEFGRGAHIQGGVAPVGAVELKRLRFPAAPIRVAVLG